MGTFLTIALVVMAALFLAGTHIRFWRKRYALVLGADATHYTRARDGWRLAIHRYCGGDGDPVILCHGMGANGYNMDLGDRLSLARYLKRRGYDVWNLELRGVGSSRIRDRAHGAPKKWTFDDHALSDVPAAIELVLDMTKKRRVHWVGHSLGGMVLLAYLATTDDDRVASVCALASPMSFASVGKLRLFVPLLRLMRFFPALPARAVAAFGIPFWRSLPITLLTHQGSNTDTSAIRAAMANLIEPIQPRLLAQVGEWLNRGHLVSSDGSIDYYDNLVAVSTPGCFIVGAGDLLAHPEDVRAGFDQLRTRLKEFYLIGKATGAQEDYGHGDIAIGRNAPSEVYSLVEGWLDDRRRGRRLPRTTVSLHDESSTQPPRRVQQALASHPRRNPYDPYSRRRRERAKRLRADALRSRRVFQQPADHDRTGSQ